MTPAEALKTIHGAASARQIRFSEHAELRMAKRGATVDDVLAALLSATCCTFQSDRGTWKVPGMDRDGDDLTCVVAVEHNVVVVTLF